MKNFNLSDIYDSSNPHIFTLNSGDTYQGFIKQYDPTSHFFILHLNRVPKGTSSSKVININDIVDVAEVTS